MFIRLTAAIILITWKCHSIADNQFRIGLEVSAVRIVRIKRMHGKRPARQPIGIAFWRGDAGFHLCVMCVVCHVVNYSALIRLVCHIQANLRNLMSHVRPVGDSQTIARIFQNIKHAQKQNDRTIMQTIFFLIRRIWSNRRNSYQSFAIWEHSIISK